jgi:hypothetical protein
MSSAINPGPMISAHSRWIFAERDAASNASKPRAISPVIIPERTSPDPAVASHAACLNGFDVTTVQSPFGRATSVWAVFASRVWWSEMILTGVRQDYLDVSRLDGRQNTSLIKES